MISTVVIIVLRRFFRKVPVAWVIEGNNEKPIAWDRKSRIEKIINTLIRKLEEIEKNKTKKAELLDKCFSELRARDQQLELYL